MRFSRVHLPTFGCGLLLGLALCWLWPASSVAEITSSPTNLAKRTAVVATSSTHRQEETSLKHLFQETQTDKGIPHRYYRNYDRTFREFRRTRGVRVLEIGAQFGNSLLAWEKYFRDPACIVGIAYGQRSADPKEMTKGKISVVWGDQANRTLLRSLCKTFGPFHIVIDDGSHVPADVFVSFEELSECMQPDAMYTIEDVETSYWNKPGATIYGRKLGKVGLKKEENVIEKFKQVADVINRETFLNRDYTVIKGDHLLASVGFEYNLIFMRFIGAEDPINQPYRYPEEVDKQQ